MELASFPKLRCFCARLRSVVFHSRYHQSGAIVARLAVCSASLIWAVIVLIDVGALGRTLYGSVLVRLAPYWLYGVILGSVAFALLCRIWHDCAPHWIGVAGYSVVFGAWLFVALFLTFAQRPVLPTAIATVYVITGLALYAFLASPRPENESRC